MIYHHRRCWKWLPPASIHSCARIIMLRYNRCNTVILMAATAWLMSFSSCIGCGFDSYTALFKCLQRNPPPPGGKGRNFSGDTWKVQYTNQIRTRYKNWRTTTATQLQPSKSPLHRVYLNMVTARPLTNCSNTLRNIHINARENITRTGAKRKAA